MVVALALAAWHYLGGVLAAHHLALGFDFLGRATGIGIAESVISVAPQDSFAWLVFAGLLNTLRVCAVSVLAATMIGVLVGIARMSNNALVAAVAAAYVEVVRNIPLLLQVIFWYSVMLALPPVSAAKALVGVAFLSQRGLQTPAFTLSWSWLPWAMASLAGVASWLALRARRAPRRRVFGFALCAALGTFIAVGGVSVEVPIKRAFNYRGGWTLSPEFVALCVAQSLYAAAFIADLIRGGIEAVPRGQWEAAKVLRLGRGRTFRSVILPQALLAIVPSLTTQYVTVIKNSSLAVAIGYPDLFWALSSTLNLTGHVVEGIALMLLIYLLPSWLAVTAMHRFNARVALRGRP